MMDAAAWKGTDMSRGALSAMSERCCGTCTFKIVDTKNSYWGWCSNPEQVRSVIQPGWPEGFQRSINDSMGQSCPTYEAKC